MLKEQRSYNRFNVEGNVVLKPQDGTSRTIKADLCNICFLGAGVCVPERIEPGVNVKFELTTKLSDESITGEGKIVYAYKIKEDNACIFRMGINFFDVDNKKIQYLLGLIQQDIIVKARKKR